MKKFDENAIESLRQMAIAMYNVKPGSTEYANVKTICYKLNISRTMLYFWLQQAGVNTSRKTRNERFIKNPSPTALMAALRGVTFPTARKYVMAQNKILRQGFATLEDLRDFGITYMKLNTVRAELALIGIELQIERRELISKKGMLVLNIDELLELLMNPRKFLFENASGVSQRWA